MDIRSKLHILDNNYKLFNKYISIRIMTKDMEILNQMFFFILDPFICI